MSDPDLEAVKDAIERLVDRRYADEGEPSTRVARLTEVLDEEGFTTNENEVRVACDQLVEEDRLVFLEDDPRAGRRYCSTAVPDGQVAALRERW